MNEIKRNKRKGICSSYTGAENWQVACYNPFMHEQIHALVTGLVHRVYFTDFVKESADALVLTGSVTETEKGIEVVAQGMEDNLTKLIQKLNQGSPLSRVESVEVKWSQTKSPRELFTIQYR